MTQPPHFSAAARRFDTAQQAAMIRVFVEDCLPAMRNTARTRGYTLAVHGSMARDLDLIAVPWTDLACDADTIIRALAEQCRDLTGWGNISGPLSRKPHGRVASTIVASFGFHIDLSVMPTVAAKEAPE